jgi:transcriptional regulator with XRE-family HTH domain
MTDNYRVLLGRRIRETREAAGYRNQADFARLLNMDASQLSRIERGLRRIDSLLLRRIAEILEVPLEALFPDDQRGAALARRGDGEDEGMRKMIDWAFALRTDIDTVSDYVGGRIR